MGKLLIKCLTHVDAKFMLRNEFLMGNGCYFHHAESRTVTYLTEVQVVDGLDSKFYAFSSEMNNVDMGKQ